MITIEELRRMLEDETAVLRLDMSAERVRRRAGRIRRRRGIAVAAAVLMVLAAGGLYVTSVPKPIVPAVAGPTTLYYSDGTTELARLGTASGDALTSPVGLIVNHVLDELSHADGSPLRGRSWESIENGGYAITTTIDPRAQQALEQAADGTADGSIMSGQPENLQAAGAVVEPGTGRVLAYFGGHDGLGLDYAGFYVDEKGEATGAGGHPPGATFMVYTLAAALKAGYSLNSRWQWTPHQQVGRAETNPIRNASTCTSDVDATRRPRSGGCSLLESTVNSINVPLYDVTLSVTPAKVLEMARDAGIDSMWTDDRTRVDLRAVGGNQLVPSRFDTILGIGQYPVTVLDQANAMATFAAGGLRARAHFVRTVTAAGHAVYTETLPDPDQPRVLNAAQLADLSHTLSQSLRGSGVALKTGTWEYNPDPNQNADAWSVGYTSALATAIWVGSKRGEQPLRDSHGTIVWGSGLPTSMLRRVVTETQAQLGLQPTAFPAPAFAGDLNPPGSYPN